MQKLRLEEGGGQVKPVDDEPHGDEHCEKRDEGMGRVGVWK